MAEYVISSLLAGLIAFIVVLVLAPFMIPFLTRLKAGQSIREEGPKSHYVKAGTPTMGGIMMITAVMVAVLAMAPRSTEAWVAMLVMLAFGGIGFWDDYIKVVLRRSLGLKAREKLVLQLLVGIIFGFFLVWYFNRGTEIIIPRIGIIDLGYLYIPFLLLVLMGTSNAVNLTDGLDGLAAGVTFFVAIALSLISIMTAHYELLIFCLALAGACAGFLVFNRHPARIFMGDTGSMALGGAVAAVASFTKMEIVLIIIGGVYVIEALSVIIQVVCFKTTGKRVFLMSPLHHHFELQGWPEKKVVRFFWLLSVLFALLGLLALKGAGNFYIG
ncbi:Phospho-N-acetylmuramoyl-pentapeptide-transferase [Thermosyntropha lipolytica DSM 11003]|uniref:Phospho-N-acetylmuramoyl-pentapeptide-transferase n=1 Tax=Thermosyntropha lipolytica DSM 11003 TaxID=1123382 RepID=A0A1M5NZA6_9FIRM|nr:phospho-N-acetylmuramoyl-pentapeptide-transferase [Thermosyntropha lipolytica]SHG94519.1 Phospho-N-acetylmuramoyl-pentapeptide-transferase [Thermosyntropha lipolytica DSM 11003]